MARQETKYGKLIGHIGEEYYYLDDTFSYDGGLRGATGSIMRPVTIEEAQYRRDNWDEDGELWRMAVEAKQTYRGHEDWVEFVLDCDGNDAVFDLSYYDYQEALLDRLDPDRKTYELVECVGGGRCFKPSMKWDELFAPELWKEIVKYESDTVKGG